MKLPSERLVSLDVFRGLTIALMIVVNDPGSWSQVYAPLLHADWHGVTPTDFVFPWFLFIVGVSIVLAYSKRLQSGASKRDLVLKLLKRSAIIFALGLFLALWPRFDFSNLRIPGVLQRIAIVFLACSLLFLHSSWKTYAWIGAFLLVGYWLAMTLIPVPVDAVILAALQTGQVQAQAGMIQIGELQSLSDNFIAGNLHQGTNLAAYLDRLLIPGRMWQVTWDPEGVLSTLPSIATGITGMLVGTLMVSDTSRERKVIWLLTAGFLAMTLGNVWDWAFPFNKNLWTSSYVLYTSGLASMTLGVLYWGIDVLKFQRGIKPFQVFGANAITAYVFHGMASIIFRTSLWGDFALRSGFLDGLTAAGFAPKLASFLWALLYTGFCYLPVWWLYRRKIFLKV